MRFKPSITARAAAVLLAASLLQLLMPWSARAKTEDVPSYDALLVKASARTDSLKNLDEAQEALNVLAAGGPTVSPADVVIRVRQQFPKADPKGKIGVLPEMKENLLLQGSEYDRLVRAVTPLLRYCWLDGHVIPILYRSKQPVIALSWPNALLVSTRALELLTDQEIESLSAHELFHLIARDLFRRAVDTADYRTLRLLELFCDAGAAAVLSARGKDPGILLSALRKEEAVLRVEYGEEDRKGNHPTLKIRDKLNLALRGRFALVIAAK